MNKLRTTRAVATRYDKRDFIYRGTIDVAAIRIWLRDPAQPHIRDTAYNPAWLNVTADAFGRIHRPSDEPTP